MILEVTPFEASDVLAMEHPGEMLTIGGALNVDVLRQLQAVSHAYTAREAGRVIACAGLIPSGPGAHLWSILSAESGPRMLEIHRAAERMFAIHPFRLITATANCAFDAGCRWLELLKFRRTAGRLSKYGGHGEDHFFYIRGLV